MLNRVAHPEVARLKRPSKFQQLFDQTHKKKGTDDHISEKAQEVAESYSRGMDERYGDYNQHPELDPNIWVAVSGAPKKGHVYGFGHSLGTTKVISSCSSSVSHVTSPFTTSTDKSYWARVLIPTLFLGHDPGQFLLGKNFKLVLDFISACVSTFIKILNDRT
ncbi:hypothetical protein Taro_005341 [Colocasia esculenta]|uniref:Uncharacterized protein n=1 Tax=Colocasia esculenta TaxID=4460 RepID=A0A843TKP5_COLES|nr:hypothetical protein [Colocasia esculenta]